MAPPMHPFSRRPLAKTLTPCRYALSNLKSLLFSTVLLSNLCYALSNCKSRSFSIALLSALWFAMSCYALLCRCQLVGVDTVHAHAPLYHCSTTTNPSEELALDSSIEHESYCVLPCLPNGIVLCYMSSLSAFVWMSPCFWDWCC